MVCTGDQAVRAVILLAESGSRLRGLVSSAPDGQAGADDRERLSRNLAWLGSHGVVHVAVQGPDAVFELPPAADGVAVSRLHDGAVQAGDGDVSLRRWLGEGAFLLLSGDRELDFDPRLLFERHRGCPGRATIGLVLATSGNVEIDRSGRILRFTGERLDPEMRLRPAGCSVVDPALFDAMPQDPEWRAGRSLITAVLRDGGILCGCVLAEKAAGIV